MANHHQNNLQAHQSNPLQRSLTRNILAHQQTGCSGLPWHWARQGATLVQHQQPWSTQKTRRGNHARHTHSTHHREPTATHHPSHTPDHLADRPNPHTHTQTPTTQANYLPHPLPGIKPHPFQGQVQAHKQTPSTSHATCLHHKPGNCKHQHPDKPMASTHNTITPLRSNTGCTAMS